ncbi:MAG: hypothetical protein ABSG65_27375 [Bryobacteraceae bacterium]|jgi:F0F1-type ATP synthase delta subunit
MSQTSSWKIEPPRGSLLIGFALLAHLLKGAIMVIMEAGLQVALSVSVPTLAVLIGILVNNSRLNDLRAQMTDLRVHMDQRFTAVDQRIGDLKELFDEKLKRVEDVMDARLTRIEQELKIR